MKAVAVQSLTIGVPARIVQVANIVRRKAGRVGCAVRLYRRSRLLQRRLRKRKLKINNVKALSIAAALSLFRIDNVSL